MSATTGSSPVCIDANVLLGRLLGRTEDQPILELWQQWEQDGRLLIAPYLIRYEVSNAIHRMESTGRLDAKLAQEAFRTLIAAPVQHAVADDRHERAVDIAARFSLPAAYDAHYLALTDRQNGEFWTADEKLVNKVGASLLWVRLVKGQSAT
jgi:predicted nucleic acid-binding protein